MVIKNVSENKIILFERQTRLYSIFSSWFYCLATDQWILVYHACW